MPKKNSSLRKEKYKDDSDVGYKIRHFSPPVTSLISQNNYMRIYCLSFVGMSVKKQVV